MTTLTAFLLIILIGFLKNPGIALFGFIFFSLTFYMASSFIPPIGDHIYHIGVANQIGGWAEAFAFDRVASSPNAPFFKFMMLLFEDVNWAVYLGNSLALAATLAIFYSYRGLSIRSAEPLLAMLIVVTLPSFLHNGVSANKDIPIVLMMTALVTSVGKGYEVLRDGSGWGRVIELACWLPLAPLAYICLMKQRHYFFAFYQLSLATTAFAWLIHQTLRIRYRISLVSAMICCAMGLALIFYLNWDFMRMSANSYDGNSRIPFLFTAPQPESFLHSLAYILKGYLVQIFLPFYMLASMDEIALPKFVVGFYEGFAFIIFMMATYLSRPPRALFATLLMFTTIHLGIQIWASPNFGAILRLRLFELMAFLTLGTPMLVRAMMSILQTREARGGPPAKPQPAKSWLAIFRRSPSQSN